MNTGALRTLVNVEENRGNTIAASGEMVPDWQPTATFLWCDVRPRGGSEYWRGDQAHADVSHTIVTRYTDQLTPAHRLKVVDDARYFEIRYTSDPDGRRQQLKIDAVEVLWPVSQ